MNYELHAETGFNQFDREQCRAACNDLGLPVGPNEGEASMRKKLCANFGKATKTAGADPLPEKKAMKGIPNLGPDGAYEGKWYFLTIHCNDEAITACPVGANGRYTNYALNTTVRMPAPHYNSLKTSIGAKVLQHARHEPGTGQVVAYDKTLARQQLYQLVDVQVDPKTAHLPEDYLEFFQRLARVKNNFKDFKREKLVFIHNYLREHVTAEVIRAWSDEDIRTSILRALGTEFDAPSDGDFDLSDVA